MAEVPRTLIAGFGNVLRGDDGFGVEVIHRLEAAGPAGDEVRLLEVGTGGLALAQELLAGYDRLIIVDAMTCGGAPGTLY
ncbi:MAG TPA: hydrogenase maturation protease, partial [Longimicrobiaceae bacterium]|nr:hydrogenase maturation protease [Longimicrobiaceae bacterium]